jgi:uncharacterized BrkB/YihY/UPF0761 family membrane protein
MSITRSSAWALSSWSARWLCFPLCSQFALKFTGGNEALAHFLRIVVFKSLALPISILILFLVYWLLPNKRLRPKDVLPSAIVVGVALELLKYINLLTLPWLHAKLNDEYGPFKNSVTIVLWSFLAAMIVLAGAEWTARRGIGPERGDAQSS